MSIELHHLQPIHDDELSRLKARIADFQRGPECADNILMEEIAEAFSAYEHGDKENALQEFAQCGAVILRIMETIEKEMK
jgi:NTP pyrophosphatase (non-canonical NTP hydrolase)